MFHIQKGFLLSVCAIFASVTPLQARELASAPELRALGFSPDGRYFAYEQFEDDELSMEGIASIDVVDRETGRSAPSFPFGFLSIEKDGLFPSPVGSHRIKVPPDFSSTDKLAFIRKAIATQAKMKLSTLKIGAPARRLGGATITDRTTDGGSVKFVTAAYLPGSGVPDQQPLYHVSARFSPSDTETCINESRSSNHTIELTIDAQSPDSSIIASSKVPIIWPTAKDECPQALRVTDVFEAPGTAQGGKSYVVVAVLAVSWAPHSEASRYFATFVALPEPNLGAPHAPN